MGSEAAAIEVHRLTRAYGRSWVLRGLSVRIRAGERVAVLGSNGAGKTTLLRVIATLLRPNGGTVTVDGYNVVEDANEVRQIIGFAGHQPLLYDALTVHENLTFYARLYRIHDAPQRIATLLDAVAMTNRAGAPAGQLSHGQRQRVSLARALLHQPAVLILDEPDTGLDVAGQAVLDELVRAGERTVLFTTHNPERAQRLADRILTLDGGVLADDSLAAARRL